jgi:hypothetical protein
VKTKKVKIRLLYGELLFIDLSADLSSQSCKGQKTARMLAAQLAAH